MTVVPVPDDLVTRLARRARRDGVPEEELVERAIRGFLDQIRTSSSKSDHPISFVASGWMSA
ncbi:hypothetical protein BH23ACT9_BH23ACT9_28420 [soil metagenome]